MKSVMPGLIGDAPCFRSPLAEGRELKYKRQENNTQNGRGRPSRRGVN